MWADPVLAAADARAQSHVGYYLVDRGVVALERALKYKPELSQIPGRWLMAPVYIGLLVVLGAVAVKFIEELVGNIPYEHRNRDRCAAG